MLIYYHGHSEFLIETADGRRVLFDPFPAGIGYPVHRVRADVVAVSHQHFDHNYVEKADGNPKVIDTEGRHTPLPGITLTGTPAWHDNQGGKKRGKIICFTLETEGLRVLHLGDLGEVPDEGMKNKLFSPDILLIPVGGFFTIDAAQAMETINLLQPRVIIPMHFSGGSGGIEQIAGISAFLEAMMPEQASLQPLLRVTREDLSQQPRFVQLSVR